jgi:hypothetical protein
MRAPEYGWVSRNKRPRQLCEAVPGHEMVTNLGRSDCRDLYPVAVLAALRLWLFRQRRGVSMLDARGAYSYSSKLRAATCVWWGMVDVLLLAS